MAALLRLGALFLVTCSCVLGAPNYQQNELSSFFARPRLTGPNGLPPSPAKYAATLLGPPPGLPRMLRLYRPRFQRGPPHGSSNKLRSPFGRGPSGPPIGQELNDGFEGGDGGFGGRLRGPGGLRGGNKNRGFSSGGLEASFGGASSFGSGGGQNELSNQNLGGGNKGGQQQGLRSGGLEASFGGGASSLGSGGGQNELSNQNFAGGNKGGQGQGLRSGGLVEASFGGGGPDDFGGSGNEVPNQNLDGELNQEVGFGEGQQQQQRGGGSKGGPSQNGQINSGPSDLGAAGAPGGAGQELSGNELGSMSLVAGPEGSIGAVVKGAVVSVEAEDDNPGSDQGPVGGIEASFGGGNRGRQGGRRQIGFNGAIGKVLARIPVNTRHSLNFREYPLKQGFSVGSDQSPQIIEVMANSIPLSLIFRSSSSRINIKQIHEPGQAKVIGSGKHTYSQDAPHILKHTVKKPIYQILQEVIVPYRKITQQVNPVQEEILTQIATSGGQLQQPYMPPVPSPALLNAYQLEPVLYMSQENIKPEYSVAGVPELGGGSVKVEGYHGQAQPLVVSQFSIEQQLPAPQGAIAVPQQVVTEQQVGGTYQEVAPAPLAAPVAVPVQPVAAEVVASAPIEYSSAPVYSEPVAPPPPPPPPAPVTLVADADLLNTYMKYAQISAEDLLLPVYQAIGPAPIAEQQPIQQVTTTQQVAEVSQQQESAVDNKPYKKK